MFGFLMPLVGKIVPWKDLLLVGAIVLIVGGGWLYIGKLHSDLELVKVQRKTAQDEVVRLATINADNVKAFKEATATMNMLLDVAREAVEAERQRNADLNAFIEDLQNVQDTDACINSEPVRRALEWLRRDDKSAPPPN